MPDDADPDIHKTVIIAGAPIEAAWMSATAGAILAAREAEEERRAAEAHKEAAARREAKIAAGFDPDDSLIEKACACTWTYRACCCRIVTIGPREATQNIGTRTPAAAASAPTLKSSAGSSACSHITVPIHSMPTTCPPGAVG